MREKGSRGQERGRWKEKRERTNGVSTAEGFDDVFIQLGSCVEVSPRACPNSYHFLSMFLVPPLGDRLKGHQQLLKGVSSRQ